MITFRGAINKTENRKLIEKNQWNQKLVLWKHDKVDKPLAKLI